MRFRKITLDFKVKLRYNILLHNRKFNYETTKRNVPSLYERR
jgi:hypothetical protein